MTGAQRDGMYLLLLGAAAFVLFAFVHASVSREPMMDFRLAYDSSRCLLQGCDPYNQSDVLRLIQNGGLTYPSDSNPNMIIGAIRDVYPPSEFPFTVLFALLPFSMAQAFWVGAIAASFLLASVLLWALAARYSPILGGALLGLALAMGFPLVFYGNPGCLTVGLVGVAAGCFLLERWEVAGVVCLAAALGLKPQDAGLVWLFFLLAGGKLRLRALQSLIVTAAICLPFLLWTWHLSPHWPHELQDNLRAFTVHGGQDDPGPTATVNQGTCVITSLQALWSNLRDEPRFYNLASLSVVTPLLLLWGIVTLRTKRAGTTAWLGLAVIAPLSMLPVYHRSYDAKLLILVVPACVLLWHEAGRSRWVALALTTLTLLLTSDLFWAFVHVYVGHLHLQAQVFHGPMIAAFYSIPVPLTLLVLSCFFLWVYARRCFSVKSPLENSSAFQRHADVQLS